MDLGVRSGGIRGAMKTVARISLAAVLAVVLAAFAAASARAYGPPTLSLVLTPASITETGGVSTVTATLSRPSIEAVTVTVRTSARVGTVLDFLSTARTLTIAARSTTSTGLVTVTANDDDAYSPWTGRVSVSGTAAGGYGVADPPNVTLYVWDDERAPTRRLVLTPSSISESGGISTVTATLSHPSSAAVTVTVSAARGAGDFALSTARTLTIAARSTTSTGLVTVTANDDNTYSPNKSVTVWGSSRFWSAGSLQWTPATLTLTDDDAVPTVALVLTPSSISETGGVSTVTATLSGKSSAAVVVTVAAAAGAGAVAADFTLSGTTLTIAARSTTSTGLVTVTANPNDVHSPSKSVTVSGTAAGRNLVANPSDATLTLTDDDVGVSLVLTPSSISESGGISTVTARLSNASSEAVTVTVAASAGTGAVAADFALSTAKTLTIAAGSKTSAGLVTVTAYGNDVDSPHKTVTVSGTASGGNGVADPPNVTLTLRDDERAPTLRLVLTPSSISESGGISTVTATLSHPSSEAVTVTVYGHGRLFDVDVDLSAATTLTIAAGSTASTGLVTVTAYGNAVYSRNKTVEVWGRAWSGGRVVGSFPSVTLTVTDDDTAGITVSPATSTTNRPVTTESGGTATFTVELDSKPTGNVVLGVASSDTDEGTVSPSVLTFTPSDWSDAQTVTLTGVDDSPPTADGSQDYTVTLTVNRTDTQDSFYDGLSALTVYARNRDNDYGLAVGAVSGQATEAGGTATFTVALWSQPSAAVTVAVSGRDGSEGTVAPPSLTFAPSAWSTAQTVTVTGKDDVVDDGTVTWAVRLDPSSGDAGYDGLDNEDVSVSTTDDDALPTVALALTPSSISESGGISTVTATLSHPSSEAVTVTVAAAAGAGAVAADFDLSSATTLTIAAGATVSTGAVTVTANGNAVSSPHKSVTVSGTAAGGNGVADPPNVTLTLEDDEVPPVALVLSHPSILETGEFWRGVSTVTATLSRPSSEAVTVSVSATPVASTGAVSGDFTLSTARTLTIAAGSTTSTGLVTVTANDNDVYNDVYWTHKTVTVSGTASGGNGVADPPDVYLILWDDERQPTVTLALSNSSISETGGVSTVTATLSGKSSAAVTVGVSAAPVASTGAVSGDFTLSTATTLTIAAGSTTSTGLVTVTANGNDVYSPWQNKEVTVTGRTGRFRFVHPSPSDPRSETTHLTLTLTDDDAVPTAALVLTPSSISETGGVSTVTATLSHPTSKAAVRVSVSAQALTGAVAGDFSLSTATTLTIAAGATTSAGIVTVTANPNDVFSPNKKVGVSGTASGGNGVADPRSVYLTLEDDDAEAAVALVLTPSSISETGGVSTVTATLSNALSGAVTVTVSATAAAWTGVVAGDFSLSAATTLTIAAGATTSTGLVTVTANGNDVASPRSKAVAVSGTAAGGTRVAHPRARRLILEDDDPFPTVTLAVTPDTILERGGVSTVTATLSEAWSEAVVVTVDPDYVSYRVLDRYKLFHQDITNFSVEGGRIDIPAGRTESASDTVLIRAVDDDLVQGSAGRRVTVRGAVRRTATKGAVAGTWHGWSVIRAALTVEDDDHLPTVALRLSHTPISEAGGVSTVTATLSGVSSEAVTVTVSATAVASSGAAWGDFALSTARTLTIAAGSTTSTGRVTVTANDHDFDLDSRDKQVTVSGAAAGGNGVKNPPNVTLTLTDEDLRTVALVLTPSSITETGGVSTVTATLSGVSSEAVTVTVSATAVASSGAVAGDFSLSAATTLTIAAGETTSTGLVTVTANGNDVASRNKLVTVSGTAAGGNNVANPPNVTLTLEDDDLRTVALALSDTSISETGGVSTVTRPCRECRQGGDGDGCGVGGDRGGRGGLHPERGDDPDHCGGFDDEHGPGDGDGERQRRGWAGQVGDDLGHGPGRHHRAAEPSEEPAERNADAGGRRLADSGAGAHAGLDYGVGRGLDGDRGCRECRARR